MTIKINSNLLKKIIPKFRDFLKTETAQEWVKVRNNKDVIFKNVFSQEKLEKMDEGILRDLVHNLWSFEFWSNKDWILSQILESGLPEIKKDFGELLYGSQSLAERFDNMRKIRMIGAATISEILAQHDPLKYPIYNRRSKSGLVALGINPNMLPASSQISGFQYQIFCDLVQNAFQQIHEVYEDINDLLDLDFLLYYIATEFREKMPEAEIKEEKFDHDFVIDQILQLGDGLGFEVKKEFFVTQGCKIDALWRSRIANLGSVAYAFEVHKSGSRDSAILNLQRCRKDPSIQKVIIVSNEDELKKFEGEMSSLPEAFRESVGYLKVEDLQEALEHQEALKEILANIGLLKTGIIL